MPNQDRTSVSAAAPPTDHHEQEERWEEAELVAMIDPTVAPKLIARHPADGWCWRCHLNAPCPTRLLAEAAERALTRRARPCRPFR